MLLGIFDVISLPVVNPQLEEDNRDEADEQDADNSADASELTSVLDKDFKEPNTWSALHVVSSLLLLNGSRTLGLEVSPSG